MRLRLRSLAAVVLGTAAALTTSCATGEVGGGQPAAPTTGTEDLVTVSLPAPARARCMTPTADVLGSAELAFDGEVVDVSGRTATLRPAAVYAGDPSGDVRVVRASRSRQALVLGVRFEEGRRYLVAANGGDVMVCGFSGPYGPRRARLYDDAFGAAE